MINVGDKLPEATFSVLTYEGMENPTTADLFANKTVVLFAVPGAFTPTCSESHLPGYVVLADQIKAKGVDSIICLSVNDAFVMQAWGEMQNANELIMLADGDGSFTKAIGLGKETGSFGGYRSSRYAMIVKDGVVTHLNVEPEKTFGESSAETMLELL
ncbi:peroxiredoxin [Motilimonas cestriensis]|uniref:Glutathione-dependent peroxiredoxin n=1 Tax=Motilimonas cestriensis TaxID=2742685 RepID=A0ABS8WF53_9GAMM|nr:peroxiredoxin [Motilimonas cestriensis]MCE2596957.1 peroxiredoxin [Motilimonas cestriensis]